MTPTQDGHGIIVLCGTFFSSIESKRMLCKYKHIFGKERDGIHSYRLLDIAIVDLLLTIVGSYFISKWLKAPFLLVFALCILVGIIAHRLFCVNTKINTLLFGTLA